MELVFAILGAGGLLAIAPAVQTDVLQPPAVSVFATERVHVQVDLVALTVRFNAHHVPATVVELEIVCVTAPVLVLR